MFEDSPASTSFWRWDWNSCISTNPSMRNPASSYLLASSSVRSSTSLSLKYVYLRCALVNYSSLCGTFAGSLENCRAFCSLRSYASMSSM